MTSSVPPLIPGDITVSFISALGASIFEAVEIKSLVTGSITTLIVTGLADPINNTDAANKQYVDNIGWKQLVNVTTTTNIVLLNAQIIDGIFVTTGTRVLVKDQNTASENGIYIANTTGAWIRANDANVTTTASGVFVYTEAGTLNGTKVFVCQTPNNALFGDNISFVLFSSGSGSSVAPPLNSIQFNSSNALAGDANLTYYPTSTTLVITGGRITGLLSPVGNTDAANKQYVDSQTGSVPGGPNFAVQYNDGSTFTGDANFIWNTTNLNINGGLLSNSITTSGLSATKAVITNTTITNTTMTNLSVTNLLATNNTISSLNVSGLVKFNNTTAVTNATTAALVVLGSIGVVGNVMLGNGTNSVSNTTGSLLVNGGIGATMDVTAAQFNSTSDIMYKTNIEKLIGPIDQLNKIEGYSYYWKKDFSGYKPTKQYGVIAQQIEQAGLENLVTGTSSKSVNYNGFIPLLIEAVKELNQNSIKQQQEIQYLKQKQNN